MNFGDDLESAVLGPLLAGVTRADGSLVRLSGAIVASDGDALPAAPNLSVVKIPDWYPERRVSYWLILMTPKECFQYEIGSATSSKKELNGRLGSLVGDLEDWLAESDVAWGEQCNVPRIRL